MERLCDKCKKATDTKPDEEKGTLYLCGLYNDWLPAADSCIEYELKEGAKS